MAQGDLKALIAYMRTIKAVKKTTGLMYEVIQGTSGGYKDMKKEDALAIAAYLKSLPGIRTRSSDRILCEAH
jgi:hypothetical protein